MSDKKARPGPWADKENADCVALYFVMLGLATTGQSYSKAHMIRTVRADTKPNELAIAAGLQCSDWGTLEDRSRASIEMKLMNCTAAHAKLQDGPTMDNHGYRAMPNYQAQLETAMSEALTRRHTIKASA